MLDLFRPPKPPEVKPQDVSVIHTLIETESMRKCNIGYLRRKAKKMGESFNEDNNDYQTHMAAHRESVFWVRQEIERIASHLEKVSVARL